MLPKHSDITKQHSTVYVDILRFHTLKKLLDFVTSLIFLNKHKISNKGFFVFNVY